MLSNEVVLITGGAGLIGQEFVKAVVKHHGLAVIADINESNGLRVQEQLTRELNSNSIEFVKIDITSKESIACAVDTLHGRHGRIDAIVNNAYPRNQRYGRDFFAVEYADFCENLSLNLGGYFLTSQQMAAYFKKQGRGNIINISSIYGVIAPRFEIYEGTPMTMPVEYAAIKSALIHLTKYMAKYLKGTNIRVNSLSPGGIFDSQPKVFLDAYRKQSLTKGMLDKTDICGTLIYLLSDLSKYVNGHNIIVDDGFGL